MVTYGEWRQDPDYTAQTSGIITGGTDGPVTFLDYDFGSARDEVVTTSPEPYYQVTEGNLAEAVEDAYMATGGEGFSTSTGVEYVHGRTLAFPQQHTNWGADIVRRRWRLRPVEGGHFYWPPGHVPSDPAAIGVQFEGIPWTADLPWQSGPAEEVGASIAPSTSIAAVIWDNSSPDGSLVDTFSTDLMIQAPEVGMIKIASIPGRKNGEEGTTIKEPLGFAVDLALIAGGWAAEFWTETHTFVRPHNLTTYPTTVDYGWGIDRLAIDWLLRPAPYRYVYDSVPYRRIFPRDDGLAGGSPRTYPPSRAVQSSSRIVGGYL